MNIDTTIVGREAVKTVTVTLSRRNLEHLVEALDRGVGMPTLRRHTEDGTSLYVVAEEDADHYLNRRSHSDVNGN